MSRLARTPVPWHLFAAPLLAAMFALPIDVTAQSLDQRIEQLRQQQRAERAQQPQQSQRQSIRQRLNMPLQDVQIEAMSAREAFTWWSEQASIPLVIDWEALMLDGVDPDQPVSVRLQHVPADHLLRMLMQQAAPPEVRLVREPTPWYVRVMTRRQANRELVVRIYDVNDLVMVIPNFDEPPTLGSGSGRAGRGGGQRGGRSGGRGGGGQRGGTGGGLFGDTARDEEDTRQEHGEQLANMVRETVEPDIWAETAGGESSVRYFDGRLIVRAPRYVHRQIGRPVVSLDPTNPISGNPLTGSASPPRRDANQGTPPPQSQRSAQDRRQRGIGPPSRAPSGIIENNY